MTWLFERVAGPFTFTEGPVWDGQVLLFCDYYSSRIMRYAPRAGACDVYLHDTNQASGLRMDAAGNLYVCEFGGRRVACYDLNGARTVLVDRFNGARLNSPNDIALDARGRLWFSDSRYEGGLDDDDTPDERDLDHGSVFRLDPVGNGRWKIHRMTYDTTTPNGLVLAPDERTLYVAQSDYGQDRKRELRAYPVYGGETLGPYEVLHNFYPHRGIDGMTLDAEGCIIATAGWSKSGPGSMIYVFAPNGRVLETHPFPEDMPTNCTFGDDDLRSLYVTTASGWVYRAQTHRQGVVSGVR